MKICVFGAGAIGGVIAAGLARVPGTELSVVARGAHMQAIRDRGLTILRGEEETATPVTVSDDPAALGPQDAVLVCLKAHQAWASAEAMLPLLGPETALVTCQNGLPWWYFHGVGGPLEGRHLDAVDRGRRQWDLLGPGRAIGCSIFLAAETVAPGVIRHISGDRFALGEPDGSASPRITRIAAALEAAGFRAPILDDIRTELWFKLWGNLCFNPVSALTGGTLDVLAEDPGTRATCRAMMLEAERIAAALGISFPVPVDVRLENARKVGAHRTSMLQDLEAGKAMEIDALVTAVQETGRLTGIETPAIDTVLALVRQLGRNRGLYPTYPEDAAG